MKTISNISLFLDRDGVLNKRPGKGYVCNPKEFTWLPGSLESLKWLSKVFSYIVIVSNQQGVGKGLMDEQDLISVNKKMLDQAKKSGGRIDGVYSAMGLRAESSFRRKPGPGMALEAKSDFPGIEFSRSLMVGDTFRDVLFGYRLGMKSVLIGQGGNNEVNPAYSYMVSACFDTLADFTDFVLDAGAERFFKK